MLDISTSIIRIEYANLAKINCIRAAARKHGGTVKVTRYSTDAYEGKIFVTSPWDEGREKHLARIAATKAAL